MDEKVNLPALSECESEHIVDLITKSLNFPRNVLASQVEIETVWVTLKREIGAISPEYRHELLARMVIAIRVGLFSSAVNEMWNTTMIVIRQKIRNFGLNEASQFLTWSLDEKKFKELKDKELLDVSIELGLIDETAYFFLNHCREIRNNYSSAHPSVSMLDGTELNYFIHQCTKHVLSNNFQPVGFRINDFMNSIKGVRLDNEALEALSDRIKNTNELQQSAILKALFGIYVEEKNDEFIRQNCLNLSRLNWVYFSEEAKGDILSLYSSYLIENSTKKQYARLYFEKVGAIDILPKDEQVSIIHKVINDLESAHHGYDNFYNETAFAERLLLYTKKVPITIIKEYVYVISLCYIGNPYGTSRSAEAFYEKMIENFTVREIDKLFELLSEDNYMKYRIDNFPRCKNKFKDLLNLVNSESVPGKWASEYNRMKK